MSHHVAFLRAINVGGRIVRMDRLRVLFEEMGFADVATFIASGNVIFDARRSNGSALERRIEQHLADALGFEVATFVRTTDELHQVLERNPFGSDSGDMFVAFTRAALSPDARAAVARLRSASNDFHVDGREIYWLRRERTARLTGYQLEKVIRGDATVRGMKTLKRLRATIDA